MFISKNTDRYGSSIKMLIVIILFFTVILPLVKMIAYIDAQDIGKLVNTGQFKTGIVNSLTVSFVASAISLTISFVIAWCILRTDIRFKGIITVIMTMPMLIPSISNSTGLIILFGTNGIFTKALGLTSNIYGFWGIIWGSVIYSFPFAFLMILDILRYENYAPYEAANILGIPYANQLTAITFPYLRKPMISVVFATFTIIFTDYGVPLAIGGKYTTLPVIMYQEVIGQLNFGKGSIIGLILLIPAVIAFVFDLINKDKGNNSYITHAYVVRKNRARDIIAYIFCTSVIVFIIVVNLSFVLLSFTSKYPIDLTITMKNVLKTFGMNGGRYLVNTIIISTVTTLVGVVSGFAIAYLTARMASKLSKVLHLIAITSLAIPGIVLGLSYVLFFKGTFIYGTMIILIMVNIIHFSASPYLMMYNTLGKVNANLEDVGQSLGISRWHIIKGVIIPQTKATIIEMGSYLFVNSMITISAVSFLATTSNKPFSLMINQFEALMLVECSAVVSLILLLINLVIKGSAYLIKRHISREREENNSTNISEESVRCTG